MDLTKELKKIDCHVHTHFAGGPLRPGVVSTWPTPEFLRPVYDELNIERGILLSCYAPENMHDPITSRDAEEMFRKHPDIFSAWFCALDPRMLRNDPARVPDFSYYIDFYRERGARGVGEIQANMYIDDPRMMGMLSHCERQDFPVLIHFGTPSVGCGIADDLGLVRLERVLTEFPKLKIIAHANSFWSEISSDVTEATRHGYPKGRISGEGRIAKLLRKFPNLLCDISARSGLNALTRDPEYGYAFIEEFYEQILYGTDICVPECVSDIAVHINSFLDEGYLSGNISAEAYRAVCRDNAVAFLDL